MEQPQEKSPRQVELEHKLSTYSKRIKEIEQIALEYSRLLIQKALVVEELRKIILAQGITSNKVVRIPSSSKRISRILQISANYIREKEMEASNGLKVTQQ